MIYYFFLAYSTVFLLVHYLQTKLVPYINWSRKATHVLSGGISYLLPVYLNPREIMILAVFFTIVLLISKLKKILSLHNVKRTTYGEVVYPLALGIMAYFFLPEHIVAFQFGVLVLTFCDASAELIGNVFPIKKIRIMGYYKSWGGSLAFFIIAILLGIITHLSSMHIAYIILIALILTVIELLLTYGLDNLIVPIAAAYLSYLLF